MLKISEPKERLSLTELFELLFSHYKEVPNFKYVSLVTESTKVFFVFFFYKGTVTHDCFCVKYNFTVVPNVYQQGLCTTCGCFHVT